MSFIRRADGVTVYNGPHVGSRGSLESIRRGEAEDCSEISDEDLEWEQRVIEASSCFGDFLYEEDTCDVEVVESLWGMYYDTCPHIKRKRFNKDYFSPAY